MVSYSHIVFDLDGTLLDTERAILSSLRDTLMALTGMCGPDEELLFVLGITSADALKRLGIADVDGGLALWNEHMRRHQNTVTLFDGVEEMLLRLGERRFSVGIVTSKSREEFSQDFDRFDIRRYFQTVVCAEDTAVHKPDPAPILKYMERAGARPEDVLYVGDSVYDSRCAQAAGVDFALALWGTHDPAIPARYRLRHPAELTERGGITE